MIDGKSVLAVIPARGGSKGLPGKNIRILCGKPLISWSIEQALACLEIDEVIVSTDDPEISRVATIYGANVPFLRPEELASDTASSIDVVLHAVDYTASTGSNHEIVILLEPTSPLRDVSDISGALNRLVAPPNCQSVVGVSQVESVHPAFLYQIQTGLLRPYLASQPTNLRRQDLEELYFLEGSVYVSYIHTLRTKGSFYHDDTAPWLVPRYKSFEVDELVDLIAIEALMMARQEGRIK